MGSFGDNSVRNIVSTNSADEDGEVWLLRSESVMTRQSC